MNKFTEQPNQSPKTQFDRRSENSEDEDLEQTSQSLSDFARTFVPPKKPHRSRAKLLWICVTAVVLAAGIAAYFVFVKSQPSSPKPPTHTSPKPTPSPPKITTKSYSSPNFNLSFDYPSTWTVTEAQDGSQIAVHSPVMQMDAATGKKTSGQVVLTIARSGQNLGEFDAGNAVAVRESEKITYKKPTQMQRANTYLSFLQYARTTINSALDAVYVTGDFGYQVGQAIPKVDVQKADPLITVTFVSCQDDTCTKNSPLSVPESVWSDKAFALPVETILTSLAVN